MKNMNIPGRYDYFLNYAIFLENMDYFLSIWKFFFQNYWLFSENLYYSLKMWTTPLYWTITWKMDYSLKYGLLYTELYTKIDYSLKIWIILWKCRLSPDNVNFSLKMWTILWLKDYSLKIWRHDMLVYIVSVCAITQGQSYECSQWLKLLF